MILRKRDRLTDTGTGFPYISVTVLTVIVAGCIIGSIVYSDSAYYMQLSEISAAPGRGHIFGTDTLGRDLFSVIWCGGRISLTVGLLATLISTAIAVVYGVVSFYTQFTINPKGKYQINVCMGTACYVKGANEILDKFRTRLSIDVGECTEDGKFSLDACRCIGACGLAPVVTINDEVFGKLVAGDVDDIIDKYEEME